MLFLVSECKTELMKVGDDHLMGEEVRETGLWGCVLVSALRGWLAGLKVGIKMKEFSFGLCVRERGT